MPRLLSIAAAAVTLAVLGLGASPAAARGAPWCAVVAIGSGTMQVDCSYGTLEQCVPYVIAGNRGICERNPEYTDPPPRKRPYRIRRAR